MLSQLTTPSCRFRAQTRSSARSQCRHKVPVVCRGTPSRAGGQQHEESSGQAFASRAAAAVLSGLLLAGGAAPVGAAGLESFPLPGLPVALGSISGGHGCGTACSTHAYMTLQLSFLGPISSGSYRLTCDGQTLSGWPA